MTHSIAETKTVAPAGGHPTDLAGAPGDWPDTSRRAHACAANTVKAPMTAGHQEMGRRRAEFGPGEAFSA